MKTLVRLTIGLSSLVLVGAFACRSSKKKPEVAQVAQDTMLLRDLAEANRNTASASAMDNSLNTVRTTGGGPPPSLVDASTTPRTSQAQGTARPSATSSQILTSDSTPRRSPPRRAQASSSGDPCDSPAPVDQRSCLNRSIVENDADLNRVYQQLLDQSRKSGGSDLEQRQVDSQRQWVNTRDTECLQQTSAQGGALWARARGRCLADYSTKRTAELQRILNSLRGQ